jgi:hypothetical protein
MGGRARQWPRPELGGNRFGSRHPFGADDRSFMTDVGAVMALMTPAIGGESRAPPIQTRLHL